MKIYFLLDKILICNFPAQTKQDQGSNYKPPDNKALKTEFMLFISCNWGKMVGPP